MIFAEDDIRQFSWYLLKIRNIDFRKIKTMSASDKNYEVSFLRNEFSNIFDDLFTMTFFTKMLSQVIKNLSFEILSD